MVFLFFISITHKLSSLAYQAWLVWKTLSDKYWSEYPLSSFDISFYSNNAKNLLETENSSKSRNGFFLYRRREKKISTANSQHILHVLRLHWITFRENSNHSLTFGRYGIWMICIVTKIRIWNDGSSSHWLRIRVFIMCAHSRTAEIRNENSIYSYSTIDWCWCKMSF